jgi:hypothetical protein
MLCAIEKDLGPSKLRCKKCKAGDKKRNSRDYGKNET